MLRRIQRIRTAAGAALAVAALSLGGCVSDADEAEQTAVVAGEPAAVQPAPAGVQPPPAPATPPAPAQPAAPPPDLRLEVDVADRKVRAFRNDEQVAEYPVAVGTEEWPTRTGEWTIAQVIWNPEWIPPREEEWAKDEETKAPGAEDNPLGRVQLVYDAPRSIHGTIAPESLGKAASHGSIRISNANGRRLARMVMEAGGAGRDEAFYDRVWENRTERVEVIVPNPVPIRVVGGGGGDADGAGSSTTGGEKGN